jgi:hypothetical protein
MYHEVSRRDYVSTTERRSLCPWRCVDDEWFHLSALLLALLASGLLLNIM